MMRYIILLFFCMLSSCTKFSSSDSYHDSFVEEYINFTDPLGFESADIIKKITALNPDDSVVYKTMNTHDCSYFFDKINSKKGEDLNALYTLVSDESFIAFLKFRVINCLTALNDDRLTKANSATILEYAKKHHMDIYKPYQSQTFFFRMFISHDHVNKFQLIDSVIDFWEGYKYDKLNYFEATLNVCSPGISKILLNDAPSDYAISKRRRVELQRLIDISDDCKFKKTFHEMQGILNNVPEFKGS